MLGESMETQRKKNQMTRQALADRLNVTVGTIFRWEKNQRTPSDKDKERLAAALNTTVAYLMGETDDSSSPALKSVRENSDNMSVGDGTAIGISARGNVSSIGSVSARAYKNLGNFFVYEYAQEGKSLRLEIPKEATREEIEQIIKGAKCATFE